MFSNSNISYQLKQKDIQKKNAYTSFYNNSNIPRSQSNTVNNHLKKFSYQKNTQNSFINKNPLNTVINIKQSNPKNSNIYNNIKRVRSVQMNLNEKKFIQAEIKNPKRFDFSTEITPQNKLSNVTQKRNFKTSSAQMDNNLGIRETTTNGIRSNSIQVKIGGNRNKDNISNYSKFSKNSQHHILRPVSINNEDHLFNLVEKENKLKNSNIKIANDFLYKINNTKENVVSNMKKNFLNRVNMIWSSYMKEQIKNNKLKVDRGKLHQEVEKIKTQFNDTLEMKTEIYIDSLKNKSLRDIFSKIDKKNNQKVYLDEDIGYLMNNQYNEAYTKNQRLLKELEKVSTENKKIIKETVDHYEKLRGNHLEVYNQEFCFKLSGDKNLVKKTLLNSLPFLQSKNQKINDKLNYLQSKNNEYEFNKLEKEIAMLESSLAKYIN